VRPQDITLEQSWETFESVAIPPEAPSVQRQAMRQAFLAGCSTVLEIEQHSRNLPLPHQRRILDKWDEDVQAAIKGQALPT
jgi:hypothetical protein